MSIDEMLKERKSVAELKSIMVETEACVIGTVSNVREVSKKLKFLILEDRTGEIQITLKAGETPEECMKEVDGLSLQSIIAVKGKAIQSKVYKGGVEIFPKHIAIVSRSASPLPIDIGGATESARETRLDWRVLDLRPYSKKLIFMLSSDFERYTREFFYERGLIEINTPKLLGAPSESGAELFDLEYFGRRAYLAQSPQFYKQMAICAGFEKVFEIGPAFRAEPSFTYRHATEFTSIDAEIGYIRSYEDIMSFEEDWLCYVLGKLREKWNDAVKKAYNTEIDVPKKPFPRITMKEAHRIVKAERADIEVNPEGDLNAEGEKALGKYAKEKLGSDFVFLTDFPSSVRPFYHMRKEEGKITCSFDLIYKGLEITTGAQREHRIDVLERQAKEKGLTIENTKFYFDFFRYGCPPHGGLGFGLARAIMCILNLDNVRETTLLPRDPNRLEP